MATITLRATKGSPLTNNEVDANFNNLNTELGTKFAAADFTGANILTQIKTVDGALSGLDADTVDGATTATANTANTIVLRDGSGNFTAGTITADTNFVTTGNATFSGKAAITSGTISGITDLAITEGGTGASTASQARTNLGLAIGTDVQAYDAQLTALGGVTAAADKVPYFTGSTTADVMTVTSTARSLLDDTSTSAMRATLGLAIGSNVQGYDPDLSAVGALSGTGFSVRTGNGTWTTRSITAGSGINITNSDGVSGNVTISTGQNVSTTGNVQFNSIGVGQAASGTAGDLKAITITETSSIAYKENISPLTGCLDRISQLQGVSFDWKSSFVGNSNKQIGLIAEEVNNIIPEVVSKNETGDAEGIQYTKLVAYLIESIKELRQEIKQLKGE